MKKLLASLLALCMVLSLAACNFGPAEEPTDAPTEAPTAPPAVSNGIESDHKHCACVGNAKELSTQHSCSEADGWIAVGTNEEFADAINNAVETPAWIYLTADLAFESDLRVVPGAKVNICLNGKTLKAYIRNYGELSVTDCTGTGTWTSAADWTCRNFSGATLNLFAGNFTITDTSEMTQVISAETGAVEEYEIPEGVCYINMFGGKLYNPNVTAKNGANVWLGGRAEFILWNGEIGEAHAIVPASNDFQLGGSIAVYGSNAAFKMYNGLVHGGEIDSGAEGAHGGNIGVYRGSILIYGGTVKDGKSSGLGGNISTGANSITELVIENATVSGGQAAKFGGNLYVAVGDPAKYATFTATLKNSTFSDGIARSGGNIFLQGGYFTTIEDCTITGGKAYTLSEDPKVEMASNIAVQGQTNNATGEGVMVITLKGNNKFEHVAGGCDILMRQYKTQQLCSKLSIAGVTGTEEILVAGNGFTYAFDITTDTNAAPILKAVEGFTLVDNNGVWNLSVTPAA